MESQVEAQRRVQLEALLAAQPEASSLQQAFYSDPAIFEYDMARIHLQRWLCAGHASEIPEAGDWFRFDVAGESLIIVRGSDGEVRALVNVCRHRGSVVCAGQAGSGNRLICPYHGWAYDLEGRLRAARNMPGLDLSAHSLTTVHCRIVEGLVFVCFAEEPPDLGMVEKVVAQSLGRYGWGDARVAQRASYTVKANWKLVTENYQECYHCRPSHPEFARFHASERPDEATVKLRKAAVDKAAAQGIVIEQYDLWPAGEFEGQEGVDCAHDAMYEGSVTGSQDGSPLAPLMGDFQDYCGGLFTYVEAGPASFFLAYPDHGLMYLFTPRGVQETDMQVLWLVDGKAEEGRDYAREKLTWLWDVTSLADKRIIENNQRGVNSRYYVPGPYGPMERLTCLFSAWYLEQIRP
jgi:Rieske 2Fe-2S family protein